MAKDVGLAPSLIVTDLFEVRVLDTETGEYRFVWRCYAKYPDGSRLEDFYVKFDAPNAAEAVKMALDYYEN